MASDFADLELSNLTLLTSIESEMQDEDQLQNDKEDRLHFRRRYFFWWKRRVCGFSVGISNFHFQKQLKRHLTMGMERNFKAKYDGNGVVPIDLISER